MPSIDRLVQRLEAAEPRIRANTLRSLAEQPIADTRLLEAAERLLDDRTLCLLSLPYQFGEVRWCAADAVAAIRAVLGRRDPVELADVFGPHSSDDVARLAAAAGITTSGGIDGALQALEELRAMNRLPGRRIVRDPVDYAVDQRPS